MKQWRRDDDWPQLVTTNIWPNDDYHPALTSLDILSWEIMNECNLPWIIDDEVDVFMNQFDIFSSFHWISFWSCVEAVGASGPGSLSEMYGVIPLHSTVGSVISPGYTMRNKTEFLKQIIAKIIQIFCYHSSYLHAGLITRFHCLQNMLPL